MLIIWESLRIPLNNMSLLAGEAIVISSFESLEESMQSGLECLDLLQLVQLLIMLGLMMRASRGAQNLLSHKSASKRLQV